MDEKIKPVWGSGVLPTHIERIAPREAARYKQRYELLTYRKSDEIYESDWPKKGQSTLAIQDGFQLTNQNAKIMDRVFRNLAPQGVVCWATDDPDKGYFGSTYDDRLRSWIERGLVISPVSIIAKEIDLVLIIDDLLVFTLIGGDSKTIALIASEFGGLTEMRNRFERSLEEYYPDRKDSLRNWLVSHVLQFCDW